MATSTLAAILLVLVFALVVVGVAVLAWRAWRMTKRVKATPPVPSGPPEPSLAPTIHEQHAEAHRIVRDLSRERDLWPERERIISEALLDADARVGAGYGRRAGDIRRPLTQRPEGQGR